jgi:hypothetical protein
MLCLSISITLFAQKEDNVWVFGYTSTPIGPGSDRVNFIFNDSLEIEYTHGGMQFWRSYASICDSSGQLIQLSNGCYIESGGETSVQNSQDLNPGYVNQEYCAKDSTGYPAINSMVFLQKPGNSSEYYLFHISNFFSIQPLVSYNDKLYLTKIDIENNEVIEKNIVIIQDTIHYDNMHCVRHANGRDWWIVVPVRNNNKYYTVLVSQDEINVQEQQIGLPTWSGAGGEMVFSPDGTKLARFNTRDDLRLFDFDRCTGTLSNPIYIPIPDDADNELFAGLVFSADGRYLYASEVKLVLQFDMHASDIGSSMVILAEIESDPDCPLGKSAGLMELGPDGRIYCIPLSGQTCMHRINHPERGDDASEFVQHYYKLQFPFQNLPHFPNFRLGPVDGSPCDTLGLDNHPLAGWRYERTGGLGVDFTSVSWYEPTEWHWVFGDGSAGSTERNPSHTFPAAGPYDVCLTVSNANGSDTKCKTVWVGTSSASSGPDAVSGGIRVYPNPASGFVTVQGAPSAARVRVYDRLGRLVLESALEADRFDAGALPNGMYVVQVWDERGPLVDAGHSTLVVLR